MNKQKIFVNIKPYTLIIIGIIIGLRLVVV